MGTIGLKVEFSNSNSNSNKMTDDCDWIYVGLIGLWLGQLVRPTRWNFFFLLWAFALSGCGIFDKPDDEPLRVLRGHNQYEKGIGHGIGLKRGERLCSYCHGESLAGGDLLIPSCYQCHGKNWKDSDSNLSLAPPDHTVDLMGFMHHPELRSPTETCVICHGDGLQGGVIEQRPSCYLCHDDKWN